MQLGQLFDISTKLNMKKEASFTFFFFLYIIVHYSQVKLTNLSFGGNIFKEGFSLRSVPI